MDPENDIRDKGSHSPATTHPMTTNCYEIRVRDHLDPGWWHWFEGWSLSNLPNGEMVITCADIDQAALHGVLNKIRDLNLTLISVTRID